MITKNSIAAKAIKILFCFIIIICISVLGAIGYMMSELPSTYNVIKGQNLEIDAGLPIVPVYTGAKESDNTVSNTMTGSEYDVTLKLLGVFPISKAKVEVVDETSVEVLGNPFGIKIYTDGVMVVGITDVDTETGSVNPSADAGLTVGDLIITIENKHVYSNEDVAAIIEESGGKSLRFQIKRENKEITLSIKPVQSYSSGKYKAGIWVRDSSAGIGTLTFYSPAAEVISGLGHGICDIDTGELLTLNSGELVNAEILSLTRSVSGTPGELKGRFLNSVIGNLKINGNTGVYGTCKRNYNNNNLYKIAMKQEIKVGDAQILTTIDGTEPKLYNCKIEKISFNDSITKNMIIKVTDNNLIAKTGGIVQGMSGSPILQNGKLVGAVTHVFVNDSSKGYAIFAENMLNTAREVELKTEKSAS